MNSVTCAFSEIRGRSYGGGVLELEPNEADGAAVPSTRAELPLADLDLWARRKEADQILDEVDRLVLADCGLTAAEITDGARASGASCLERRLARKRR